jgi:hypothetical protein
MNDSGDIYSLGKLGVGELAPETKVEITDTEPYLTLHNSTQENIEGGRESRINFKGEKLDTTEHFLARIQASHDGTGDDTKGDLILYVNDGTTMAEALRLDSAKDGYFVNDVQIANDLGVGGSITTTFQKISVLGAESNQDTGPNIAYYTTSDTSHPIFHQLNFNKDNIAQAFGCYYDGGWKNTDDGSQFLVYKISDAFHIYYDDVSSAPGSTVTLNEGFKMDKNGQVTKSNQAYFNAYLNSNVANVIGGSAWYTVPFGTERIDRKSDFSTTTYASRTTGLHDLFYTVGMEGFGNTNTDLVSRLVTSNKNYRHRRENAWQNRSVGGELLVHGAERVDMDALDTAKVEIYCNGSTVVDLTGESSGITTHFKGGLVC